MALLARLFGTTDSDELMEEKLGASSLSGVLGIEARVRDAIALLVRKGLDNQALEGIHLLLDLRDVRQMAPGNPQRTGIVTLLIGFHSRALLALAEHEARVPER